MGRVLTVLAEHPPSGGDRDQAIEDVREALETQGHEPRRAYSVETLAEALEKDTKQNGIPDVVQIIGHGSAGVLYLGASWNGKAIEDADGPIYVVNSNPDWYGLLVGLVAKKTRVLLLGCSVGSVDDPGLSFEVADGPTLLFDLARMWGGEVCAPDVLINPKTDFEKGVYKHERRLVRAKGLSVTPPEDEAAFEQRLGVGAPRSSDRARAAAR